MVKCEILSCRLNTDWSQERRGDSAGFAQLSSLSHHLHCHHVHWCHSHHNQSAEHCNRNRKASGQFRSNAGFCDTRTKEQTGPHHFTTSSDINKRLSFSFRCSKGTNSKNLSIRSLTELMASDSTQMPRAEIHQDDTAMLLYSSGTTGLSKGVITTHRNLISMVCIALTRFKKATFVCTVPMFHVFGFGTFACGSLASGSTTVVLSKFEQSDLLGAVDKYRVNYLPLVPPILMALAKSDITGTYDLGSLHTVVCGGAPLGKETTQEFVSRFPKIVILQGFGMTETTGMGAFSNSVEEGKHYGSVGMICPNTEAKIVDPQSGIALAPNQRGELWLRGPTIMKGYFSNQEATGSALDKNGWLHTGDICCIDNEGYVFVVDRLKELIKYKAYQVVPAELEAVLLSHADVTDAAVIPFPDKEAGQVPMAYVVRKQGSALSEAAVIDFVSKQVAAYKKVRRVAFVIGIPKTAVGKILRKDLIKLSTSKL